MTVAPRLTCSTTVFYVSDCPATPTGPAEPWLGVATAHVFDSDHSISGLSAENMILSGEVARVIIGRASSNTEIGAARAALDALLFQLQSKGLLGAQ